MNERWNGESCLAELTRRWPYIVRSSGEFDAPGLLQSGRCADSAISSGVIGTGEPCGVD